MNTDPLLTIRPAVEEDTGTILSYVRELADYEQLLHEVTANEEEIRTTLFGDQVWAQVLMAELDGENAGFALFHHMYSTFIARPGIYLEDLYVPPKFRSRGIGKSLLVKLAGIAVEEGQCRLDWSCLRWNEPSINFYKNIGAIELEDWTRFRLEGAALESLAGDTT